MSIVSVNGIQKSYKLGKTKVHALRGIDLQINKGDFISLMGPSGAGKSTLLHIIGCIEKPDSGDIIIHGNNIKNMSDKKLSDFRNKHIGFIFQSFNLIPVFNVYENVEYPLMIRDEKVDQKRVEDIIDAVGLKDKLKCRPDELSGGQRQRVAIARALVTQPDIIIADEPTANLDSKTGQMIIDLLLDLNQTRKTTFIFSTHNKEITKYSKKTINILDGLLINEKGE
ncbi:MAG: ABC transporter ATP-binding protein [Fusobacteriota bacterium]